MAFLFRYGVALFTGLISSSLLFLLYKFPLWPVFFGVFISFVLYFVILQGVYLRHFEMRFSVFTVSIISWFSFVGLMSLTELNIIAGFLLVFCALVFGLLVMSVHYQASVQLHIYKPIRRMTMMLLVFDAYAFLTTLFGLALFFPELPVWIWGIIQSVFFVGITYTIWRLYFSVTFSAFSLWFLLIGVMMLELFWVFQIFPFGYLVSGFLLTWIWYLMQLFVRFHLSEKGIVWKKQRNFLIYNSILYIILLLLIVRWI